MDNHEEEQNINVFYWGSFFIVCFLGIMIFAVITTNARLFLGAIVAMILTILCMSLVLNYADIEFKFTIMLLGRSRLKFWQHRLVEKRYALLSNRILETKKFHLIKRIDQFALIPIIKYLEKNPEILAQMTEHAQDLIHNCVRKNFHYTTLDAFYKYYEYSTKELIDKLVQEKYLAAPLRDRIINEADYEDQQIIERMLPTGDELLEQIYSRHSITLQNGFDILI
ncbi:hypothetical protein NEF87_002212 [Candidatus Lokiarchaeum ossiferum]|uniref:Uncharacterized protein n=1 Tax=Candidatus Lokiarchaeum ossiferum TaxID=2951803 RepID=A0ABY6HST4_9ARCH|nr:hypothetical protein NEF87_002212 [Candidatus Lokiarchaeum sp. B-35]